MDSTHNLQTFPSTAISAFTKPSPPPPPPPTTSSPSVNGSITATVIGTAASSFALFGLLFFAFYQFTKKRRSHQEIGGAAASGRWRCDHYSSIVDKRRHFDNVSVTGSPEPRRRRSISPPPPPPPPTPPPPPRKKISAPVGRTGPRQNGPDGGSERPRLKRLHWEKVTPMRAGHSMVWDRINNGSIRFDDEQMEALFGYVSPNQNPPKPNSGEPPSSSTTTITASGAAAPTQISLLDARKSQNIAIILRTLAAPRHEILESLRGGRILAADTLEKLSRIALTKDEESLIVSFSGDPTDLADADSFLFHLLQTLPSALPCIQAMHFRSCIYNPEILHLKQCLHVLQLACTELKTRGLFLKLLEAILKAGNRMNAGTARGDAEAFDLAALRKLSDVKSTDGKTTLLHFVVGEVVRSEGKCLAAITAASPETLGHKDGNFMTLGLPAVGALSSEFMNVKKAAAFDCDAMDASCSAMAGRVRDIGELEKEEGVFVREMKRFVEVAEKEIMEVREEKRKVMEIVRRTTEYYQLGVVMKEKEGNVSLQIFVIVRDFLAMVDQACVDISRNVKKKELEEKENLPDCFMRDSLVCRSDSEEEL